MFHDPCLIILESKGASLVECDAFSKGIVAHVS